MKRAAVPSAPFRKPPIRLPGLLLLALLLALPHLARDLWFDEALTAIVFLLPYGFRQIYWHYTIPNNQIVYTWLLKAWHTLWAPLGAEPTFCWRLLSILLALAAVALAAFFLRRAGRSRTAWGCALLGMILAPAFALYASAVRGYAASWFFLMLTLWGARDLALDRPRRGLPLYFCGCFLACGAIPTNLAGCAAAALYGLSLGRGNLFRRWQSYALILIPPLAFLLFWFPIRADLLQAAALGEGAPDRWLAAAAVYGMLALAFAPLLPGQLWLVQGSTRSSRRLRLLIWFLPLVALLLLPTAPFPRTFVPLLPLYAVLAAEGTDRFLAARPRSRRGLWSWGILAAVLLWGGVAAEVRFLYSRHCSGENDDVLNPWYCRNTYSPFQTARELYRRTADGTDPIYVSFAGDPYPILFYYTLTGGDPARIVADVRAPWSGELPSGAWVILRREEPPETVERRFRRTAEWQFSTPFHRVWRLR